MRVRGVHLQHCHMSSRGFQGRRFPLAFSAPARPLPAAPARCGRIAAVRGVAPHLSLFKSIGIGILAESDDSFNGRA